MNTVTLRGGIAVIGGPSWPGPPGSPTMLLASACKCAWAMAPSSSVRHLVSGSPWGPEGLRVVLLKRNVLHE